MVYAADTLRDTLFSNYALSGEMLKEGSATATMKETVHFFAYPQQEGQYYPKSVEVIKINAEQDEQVKEHPQFNEVSDHYQIIVRYRVTDIQITSRDTAEANTEDICAEIVRILKTVYQPSSSTGPFFAAARTWANEDKPDNLQPELIRRLTFTLTKITSDETEVFHTGYGGVLVFDTSTSTGDSKPVSDFTYAEVYNTDFEEGSEVKGVMTRNSSLKTGTQIWFRTKFQGIFRGELMAKKSDMNTATLESLDNIYKAQNNGELGTVVLLDSMDNTEGSPATLTMSMKMHVTNMKLLGRAEDLVKITMTGRIISPSTWTVA